MADPFLAVSHLFNKDLNKHTNLKNMVLKLVGEVQGKTATIEFLKQLVGADFDKVLLLQQFKDKIDEKVDTNTSLLINQMKLYRYAAEESNKKACAKEMEIEKLNEEIQELKNTNKTFQQMINIEDERKLFNKREKFLEERIKILEGSLEATWNEKNKLTALIDQTQGTNAFPWKNGKDPLKSPETENSSSDEEENGWQEAKQSSSKNSVAKKRKVTPKKASPPKKKKPSSKKKTRDENSASSSSKKPNKK